VCPAAKFSSPRVDNLHPRIPVHQYLRITLNWVTIAFFLFSFLHCFAQGTIQSFLFGADDLWSSVTSNIVAHADIDSTIFPQFTGRHGAYSLALCNDVPVKGVGPDPCVHFFTAGQSDPVTIPARFLPPGSSAVDIEAPLVRPSFLPSSAFPFNGFLMYSHSAPSISRTW